METETLIINSREDFAQWAMDRANCIIVEQGSSLATAARTGDESQIADAARRSSTPCSMLSTALSIPTDVLARQEPAFLPKCAS